MWSANNTPTPTPTVPKFTFNTGFYLECGMQFFICICCMHVHYGHLRECTAQVADAKDTRPLFFSLHPPKKFFFFKKKSRLADLQNQVTPAYIESIIIYYIINFFLSAPLRCFRTISFTLALQVGATGFCKFSSLIIISLLVSSLVSSEAHV